MSSPAAAGRGLGEGRAHQRDGAEHVGPDQRGPCHDCRAEIVPDHCRDRAQTERPNEAERVADEIEDAERGEVAIVSGVPAGGASVAALVGRDHVVAGRRQREHHLAPAVGKLGKAVQQQEARAVLLFEPRLKDVHAQAVDVVDEARADAGGKGFKRLQVCHRPLHLPDFREYGTWRRGWATSGVIVVARARQ